jgi:hypothetical protein
MNKERQPIRVEDVPWDMFSDPDDPGRPEGPWVRWLVDPASGNRVVQVKSWPGRDPDPHWHLSDTLYIVTKGELHIGGEPPYKVGDIRWVRGGFAYGPERAGTEECEYIFISLGPYDKFDPDEFPPPLGRWDDPSTWVEGYPQVHRRTVLAHDPRRDGTAPCSTEAWVGDTATQAVGAAQEA